MKARFNRASRAAVTMLLLLLLLTLTQPVTHAFPVPGLPGDNLIVNPWFRSANDRTAPGFDGWTRLYTNGVSWGPSQKESNPSPDIVVSGTCGFKEVYCGTAARWAEQSGVLYPNIDVFMYQVVAADPSQRQLRFFSHYVSHRVERAAVTIFGSNSPDGPWTVLWIPLNHSQPNQVVPENGGQEELWEQTGFLERGIEEGYPYYKIEVQARLPELPNGQIRGAGFKLTGIYFATSQTGDPGSLPATAVPPATATTAVAPEVATAVPTEVTEETGVSAESTPLPPVATTAPVPTSTTASVVEAATEAPQQGVTDLRAEGLSATEISLDWREGGIPQRGVRLERSLNETAGWKFVSIVRPGESSFTDSGLSPDTLYYYRLRVTRDSTSGVVSARTEPPAATPSATTTERNTAEAIASPATEAAQSEDEAADGTQIAQTSPALDPTSTLPSVASEARDWRSSGAVIFGTLLVGAGIMVARRRRQHDP